MRLATVGRLPRVLRTQYGFAWGARRAAVLDATTAVIRRMLPILPSTLRHWPAARAAVRPFRDPDRML